MFKTTRGQLLVEPGDYRSFKITTQPQHGVIREVVVDGNRRYQYIQDKSYVGRDGYVAEVMLKGRKFVISGVILQMNGDGFERENACRAFKLPGLTWKISWVADPADIGGPVRLAELGGLG
ncbi:hypothetical protein [Roseateles sp. BYS96W]|uniref:Uncharacterized protein n=1 Tax=Pelomonas nitida TaxID=3299027 RepID=A0ABW7G4U7_9BURK